MKYVLSVLFFTGASYFLNKYGISIVKTPADFMIIVTLFTFGNGVLYIFD